MYIAKASWKHFVRIYASPHVAYRVTWPVHQNWKLCITRQKIKGNMSNVTDSKQTQNKHFFKILHCEILRKTCPVRQDFTISTLHTVQLRHLQIANVLILEISLILLKTGIELQLLSRVQATSTSTSFLLHHIFFFAASILEVWHRKPLFRCPSPTSNWICLIWNKIDSLRRPSRGDWVLPCFCDGEKKSGERYFFPLSTKRKKNIWWRWACDKW